MKASKYNVFFPYLDNVVGYNSLENDYILFSKELYELYNKALANGVVQLETLHPELWKVLVDKHFIVSNEIDELLLVKQMVYSIERNSDMYHLIINPTLNCNLNCWYCYETHVRGSKMNNITIEKVKRHIINILSDKTIKYFVISWFGGEPLLYYKQIVLPILEFTNEYTADKGIQFNTNFTSNGILINNAMIENFKRLKIDKFQITLDGHREQHNGVRYLKNGSGSYDKIVSNIKKCLKNKIYITTCRINISKDTFAGIEKIVDDFSDLSSEERGYLLFSFHKVWQEKENIHNRIIEIANLFTDNNFKIQHNAYTDTVRNSCYADKLAHATINYNGYVFKCTARDFTSDKCEGILKEDGNIEWNEKYYARLDAKFKNQSCLTCRILPICNGGCSQKALDNKGEDYCIRNYDEDMKIEVIRAKLEAILD